MLRDDSGQNLRDYLIETAARMIDQRGSAGLAVRDIAREAKVADGVLYNYFEDKEDLLVHALLAHVGNVMASAPGLLPPPGEGAVADNLRVFIDGGIANLLRVTPAFAGLLSQPKVLTRFHAMVGGDLRLSDQPGERRRDPEQSCDAAVDERPQVLRDRALPRRRQQLRRAVHHVADVGEQRVDELVFLVLEVVVEHTVGDLGFTRDVPDRQAGAASLVDQPGSGGDQVVAQVLAAVITQHGRLPR